MMIRNICFVAIAVVSVLGAARANWEYSGEYTYDTAYYDNGERFTVSVRGGATFANSKIKNDVRTIITGYYMHPETGQIITESEHDSCGSACDDFEYIGTAGLGGLEAKKLRGFAWTAGVSVGWVLPNAPQWRIEGAWDHFADVDYNESPLFSGDLTLSGGTIINIKNGGGAAQSTITTDVISAMVFYDFFDGYQKPLHKMIPYVGLGFGYADSKTVLNLSDPWGYLSENPDLWAFGEEVPEGSGVLQFYQSTTNTSNVAAIGAIGFSYGLNKSTFVDFGVRAT